MKKNTFVNALNCLLVIFLLSISSISSFADSKSHDNNKISRSNEDRVKQGLAIAPVPLNITGKNRALVGLGSYLVNSANGCSDCHTEPAYVSGGNPFAGEPEQINTAGYLAGGRVFGPVTSPNITPDNNGLPAGLTFKEFINVMRTGQDPDQPSRLLQVMPWPYYGKMTTADLKAIYEYLREIPSITTPAE